MDERVTQAGLFPEPARKPRAKRDVYTVSRLNREVCQLLEGQFFRVWVEGELSNLSRPSSGHLYFSLKDASAQVRCTLFRSRQAGLGFTPRDGLEVLVRGRVSLYQLRGEYQLNVDHMEEAGEGALRRAFEALKARLASEGLFEEGVKRPLPALPRRIGVLTSPSGAAIRDILQVLGRRFPAIPVLLYPIPVQGAEAAPRIAQVLRQAARRAECDVLILARGGGSLEDLWAFNEEIVARAIRACPIPVVCAVGHEADVTIADFAADVRAPTPSAAAALVVPDAQTWLRRIEDLDSRIARLLRRQLERHGQRLGWLAGRLEQQHPGARLRQRAQRLDELEQRLAAGQRRELERLQAHARHLATRLLTRSPASRVERLAERTLALGAHLQALLTRRLERDGQHLGAAARALHAVSPLGTLERGYAIVSDETGAIVSDSQAVSPGDTITARLARGRLQAEVRKSWRDEE